MKQSKKAFYNLFRLHWLDNPQLDVEPWQVEDYRALSREEILQRLAILGVSITPEVFCEAAYQVDTPEELTMNYVQEFFLPEELEDPIYLLLFALWLQLVPEKRPLSVFCDELDERIFLYDTGRLTSSEPIENALSNLLLILAENRDAARDPKEIFAALSTRCAHPLETFLYDFTTDLIDAGNRVYAKELLEEFSPYISEIRWFDFLLVRILSYEDPEVSDSYLEPLLRKTKREGDLDLQLEILSFMVQNGDRATFRKVAKASIPLLKSEEHFQDLLCISSDFFHCIDEEEKEQKVEALLEKRENISPESGIQQDDTDVTSFLKLMRNG